MSPSSSWGSATSSSSASGKGEGRAQIRPRLRSQSLLRADLPPRAGRSGGGGVEGLQRRAVGRPIGSPLAPGVPDVGELRGRRGRELAERVPPVPAVHRHHRVLLQRGSPESKEMHKAGRKSDREQKIGEYAEPDSPRWARVGGVRTTLYSHSLALVMGMIFFASWLAQSIAGCAAFNEARLRQLQAPISWTSYLTNPDFGPGLCRTGSRSSSPWAPWPSSPSTFGSAAHQKASPSANHTTAPASRDENPPSNRLGTRRRNALLRASGGVVRPGLEQSSTVLIGSSAPTMPHCTALQADRPRHEHPGRPGSLRRYNRLWLSDLVRIPPTWLNRCCRRPDIAPAQRRAAGALFIHAEHLLPHLLSGVRRTVGR